MALNRMNNALAMFQGGAREGPVFITQSWALEDTHKYMAQSYLFWSLYKSCVVIQLAEFLSPATSLNTFQKYILLSNIFHNANF